ncbi:S8 family serine peptidase [Patescibacteria group bacterium]|nr:S8 family serine peptidase [Patescibacteria group bacterium]
MRSRPRCRRGCGPDGTSGCADGVLQQTFATNDPSDFGFFFFQGTSMAAPHVTALAALILAVDSSLSTTSVRAVIELTAEDKGPSGRDDEYGHGIIDARAALLSLIPLVSITLDTDGTVAFGILPLGSVEDTTLATGINDTETILVTAGPADLDVKSTVFSDGTNTWSLGTASGANQVKWEFSSNNGSTWTTFSAPNDLFNLANSVAEGATQDLHLRITMPSESVSGDEYSSTVTIVATSP